MAQRERHSLSKYEDMDLDPQKPCKAGGCSTCFSSQCSKAGREAEKGEHLKAYRAAGLVLVLQTAREPILNKAEGSTTCTHGGTCVLTHTHKDFFKGEDIPHSEIS